MPRIHARVSPARDLSRAAPYATQSLFDAFFADAPAAQVHHAMIPCYSVPLIPPITSSNRPYHDTIPCLPNAILFFVILSGVTHAMRRARERVTRVRNASAQMPRYCSPDLCSCRPPSVRPPRLRRSSADSNVHGALRDARAITTDSPSHGDVRSTRGAQRVTNNARYTPQYGDAAACVARCLAYARYRTRGRVWQTIAAVCVCSRLPATITDVTVPTAPPLSALKTVRMSRRTRIAVQPSSSSRDAPISLSAMLREIFFRRCAVTAMPASASAAGHGQPPTAADE